MRGRLSTDGSASSCCPGPAFDGLPTRQNRPSRLLRLEVVGLFEFRLPTDSGPFQAARKPGLGRSSPITARNHAPFRASSHAAAH